MKPNANAMIALLTVLTAVGCENMGLYDAGPADEARQEPPSPLVRAVIQPTPTENGRELVMDGRLWIAAGVPISLDSEAVRPIGSANGRAVHARTWDRAPYDQVFTPTDDERRWLAYRPVLGGDVPEGTAHSPAGGEGADAGADAGAAADRAGEH